MIKRLELPIEQFFASCLIDREGFDVHPSQITVEMQYRLEHLAHMIVASLRVPGQKLPRTLVATYPATWWDHLKKRLGWKHKTTKVYREDTAVFPSLPLPPDLLRSARIYTVYRAEPEPCFRAED